MDIVVGSVVRGDDLYGRDSELRLLWKMIEKDSLLLTSPRRYGKTSVVNAMKDNPLAGWSVIYIDMEGSSDPYEFVVELLEHANIPLSHKMRNLFRSARGATDEFQLGFAGIKLRGSNNNWKKNGTEIFREMKKNNPKSIVIIDELTTYLLNMQKKYRDDGSTISTFLHWLRGIRQDLQIRFIVCGSVGIDSTVHKYGLKNAVNDFAKLSLPPFNDTTAKGMITTLLDKYGIGYTDGLIKKIMESIGLQVPFFILIGGDCWAPREKVSLSGILTASRKSFRGRITRSHWKFCTDLHKFRTRQRLNWRRSTVGSSVEMTGLDLGEFSILLKPASISRGMMPI